MPLWMPLLQQRLWLPWIGLHSKQLPTKARDCLYPLLVLLKRSISMVWCHWVCVVCTSSSVYTHATRPMIDSCVELAQLWLWPSQGATQTVPTSMYAQAPPPRSPTILTPLHHHHHLHHQGAYDTVQSNRKQCIAFHCNTRLTPPLPLFPDPIWHDRTAPVWQEREHRLYVQHLRCRASRVL